MPQYEVTTILSIRRVHTVDASDEYTAKEQAAERTFAQFLFSTCDLEQDVVEMILPSDDAKQYA